MDETGLIERARRGSQDAFADLMRAHQNRIYSLLYRMTGNREDAADLTQEAFINAWRGLANFQGESAFGTWLYRLASNVAIDFLRREGKRRTLSITLPDGEDETRQADLPDHTPGPQERAEQRDVSDAVQAGLDRLSPEHRQILLLRGMNGLSYDELSETLGIEAGTVKSRLARARLALRKVLSEGGNISELFSSEEIEKR